MLTDPAWWTDVLERAGRQAVQVLVPILTVAALGGGISGVNFTGLAVAVAALGGGIAGVNFAGLAVAVAIAFAVVVLRALTGIRAPADAPVWIDGLDRAISAAAATALAIVGAANFDAWHADWRALAISAASAAGLALIGMFTNTPTPAAPATT